ncbi:MAG: glycosyltransferase [Acetobacteraceae bacterium]|nr:glycosyltransferase [Acetobacteraceae bacterium]
MFAAEARLGTAPSPEGLAAQRLALAQAAYETGRTAQAALERVRWLDRAHRLLPADPTLCLALAEACIGQDNRRAERLLRRLAGHDVREVWLALAAARAGLGDAEGAAGALACALSRHAFSPQLAPFADALARAAGAPGWCALSPEGGLLWGPASLAPMLRVDDGPERPAGPGLTAAMRGAGRLVLADQGRALLGSPLEPHHINRIEGFVEAAQDGALSGWAWRPSNPETDPVLTVRPMRGRAFTLVATEGDSDSGGALLARRRRFMVPREALTGLEGPFHVQGEGRALLGSPLDPRAEIRACDVPRAVRRPRAQASFGVDVVIPVHGARAVALACVDSVLASVADPARVVVVDDASPDQDLARALDGLAADERIVLMRHATPLGFPGAANAGLRAAARARRDAVLLNSDTLVAPGWLEALREAAYSASDIGTATPLSNSGSILSYPGPEGTNAVPDLAATRRLAALARRANAGRAVEIPVGVGFCLYVRGDCLRATGLLRTDLFAQGYGEENDFCLRARRLGWRHVAAPGVFVAHRGGQSFSGAGAALRSRNAAILERLHPGYDALVAAHIARDPLAEPRRRIDALRWREGRRPGAVLHVTHDQGGGVERALQARAARLRAEGQRAIVLRPARLPNGRLGASVEEAGASPPTPNLAFALPDEWPALVRLLQADRVGHVELHHLLGHAPDVLDLPERLRVPYEVHLHDYAWLCARVVLLGAGRRHCGEPDADGCAACVAECGSLLDETIGPAALRARSARVLGAARRVVVPSADAAARVARHFPGIRPKVAPHEDDAAAAAVPLDARRTAPCRVAVIGAVGLAKGYDVLLACARDARARALPLSFVVVGHTIDDARLIEAGVFVTGPYEPEEAEALIRAQEASIAFIPSVVPETWCFTLTEAWRAGLRAAAFDLGAQAERIRATGRGLVLALDSPIARINEALLATCGFSRHEGRHSKQERTGS